MHKPRSATTQTKGLGHSQLSRRLLVFPSLSTAHCARPHCSSLSVTTQQWKGHFSFRVLLLHKYTPDTNNSSFVNCHRLAQGARVKVQIKGFCDTHMPQHMGVLPEPMFHNRGRDTLSLAMGENSQLAFTSEALRGASRLSPCTCEGTATRPPGSPRAEGHPGLGPRAPAPLLVAPLPGLTPVQE